MTETPEAPAGLGTRAAELWTGVVSRYELRVDEQYVLEQACHEVDLIDRMRAKILLGNLTVRGMHGATVANPLVIEIRQHRGLLASLLRQLKLPDQGGQKSSRDRSCAARKAANTRWGNNPSGA